MKKTILLMAAGLLGLNAMAQVEIKSVKPISDLKGYTAPVFTPSGDALFLSDGKDNGMIRYDLATKAVKKFSAANGVTSELKFSEGGKVAMYRHFDYDEQGFAHKTIKRLNVENGEVKTLDAPTDAMRVFGIVNGEARIVKGNSMFRQRLVSNKQVKAGDDIMVGYDNEAECMVLYRGNRRTELYPQGRGMYLWQSLSPDKKHIVYAYTTPESCTTYVCDLNGQNVVELDYIAAPQWLGNNYIVGMCDLWDDGHAYTHSPLVFAKIDGSYQYVYDSPEHPVLLYPAASPKGDKVAFDVDGEVYLMNINLK